MTKAEQPTSEATPADIDLEVTKQCLAKIKTLRAQVKDAEHGIEVLKRHKVELMDDCATYLAKSASYRMTLNEVHTNGEWVDGEWLISKSVYQMVCDVLKKARGETP